MATFTIGKDDIAITSIAISSLSPSDVSRTEDGTQVYTYYNDAQRYSFRVRGVTTDNVQYLALATKLEVVSNADVFNFDLGSYGTSVVPMAGDITNSTYMDGATAAGANSFVYISDDSGPSGVTPNGTLGVGDFIKFKDATYNKLYRITAVNTTTHVYTVFPSLRESLTDETEILYGDDVTVRVRMTTDNFRFQQRGNSPLLRQFSLTFEEDYTS